MVPELLPQVRALFPDRPRLHVADLLDADTCPAGDLLAVYRMRWGIERMFRQITDVLHSSRLIGSFPQAGIFQCTFYLLLYNVIQLVRAHVASDTGRRRESISTENLFDDVRRELIALRVLGDAGTIASAFAQSHSPEQVQHKLHQHLGNLWHDRWLKAPTTRPRKKPDPIPIAGGHTSVFRILQEAKNQSRKQ